MVVGDLSSLVRPLMLTFMGCFIVVVVCSVSLVRSAVIFSKQVVVSNCLEAERSCRGVGLGYSVSRVLANSLNQRLARSLARGFGLEIVSVRERKCSGESTCRSLRRWRIVFGRVLEIIYRKWGFAHKISAYESR